MKRTVAGILVLVMCVLLFVGCASSGNKEITETTTVLYVESEGFIAELDGYICYVEYPNADVVVAVDDKIELTYMSSHHVIADNTKELGGYCWDTVLIKFSKLTVK